MLTVSRFLKLSSIRVQGNVPLKKQRLEGMFPDNDGDVLVPRLGKRSDIWIIPQTEAVDTGHLPPGEGVVHGGLPVTIT